MTKRLPNWVEWGAWLLAFTAGGINAVGLLSFEHQAISHVTGSVSWLGLELARGEGGAALHLALVVLVFFLGAAVSGALLEDSTLRLGRRYGVCLLLEAAVLTAALRGVGHDAPSAALWASAACGVQNAMVSTYSGAVIRTTHVTGIVTDLGLALGHWLRRLPVDGRRVRLHLLVLAGFVSGAVAGAAAWLQWGFAALWGPVLICVALALVHSVLYRQRRDQPA